jgi:hypothetical protein
VCAQAPFTGRRWPGTTRHERAHQPHRVRQRFVSLIAVPRGGTLWSTQLLAQRRRDLEEIWIEAAVVTYLTRNR